ncbi:ATP-binding protein [Staphylococcus pseudintermedius]|uniref:ATP-binding protein n=1 Tax=Staphylococcus pseudintermedius TaxID=283734 RepID=UPI0027BAE0DF|nr:ATP-binding protein [Staphylococcus pseudintermedius]
MLINLIFQYFAVHRRRWAGELNVPAHLAISLGVEACKQNIKTRFYTFKELIELLTTSEEKGITNKTLKQLNRIELLIIDEIGYTPISKEQQISSIN